MSPPGWQEGVKHGLGPPWTLTVSGDPRHLPVHIYVNHLPGFNNAFDNAVAVYVKPSATSAFVVHSQAPTYGLVEQRNLLETADGDTFGRPGVPPGLGR